MSDIEKLHYRLINLEGVARAAEFMSGEMEFDNDFHTYALTSLITVLKEESDKCREMSELLTHKKCSQS